jgi:photosystem II oxygen-evolving enhancer protein 3
VTCQASSRRSASLHLGLAAATAVLLRQPDAVRAADDAEPANNGWWLTEFPLPVPKIVNSNKPVAILLLFDHKRHVLHTY